MNDKTLLELAAKAAGYEFIDYHLPIQGSDMKLSSKWGGAWAEIKKPEAPLGCCRWNPLEDDGDALRLAETLNFGIDIEKGATGVLSRDSKICIIDKCKRRAITRAAAAIGESM